MADFKTPNLCGANPELNNVLSKLEEVLKTDKEPFIEDYQAKPPNIESLSDTLNVPEECTNDLIGENRESKDENGESQDEDGESQDEDGEPQDENEESQDENYSKTKQPLCEFCSFYHLVFPKLTCPSLPQCS